MSPSWFSDVLMVARLTRDFRSFYGEPITGERAGEIVKRQLQTRDERFLDILGQMIYRHPRSPYLQLLQAAGCEFGDVRALVTSEGLEGALSRLCDAGVYVTFDEFKGRKEVLRGSRRFTVTEADFDTPALSPHIEVRSGGTRGPGTLLKLELAFLADRAVTTALAYEAHGLQDYDKALWQITGLRPILQYTKTGKAPIAWFYPVAPLPFKSRAISWYLSALGKLFGHSLPRPVFLDLQDPGRMAQWLANRAKAGRRTCLTTYASSAVRVCAAAKELGLDFRDVAFIVIGEPYTEARSKIVEDSGAHAVVGYAFNEAGTVGFGCSRPGVPDDVHLFSNMFGLIQRRRAIGDSPVTVDAFLVTSLLTSGPKVLLNTESGDYGVVENRSCGCLLGELGLTTHLGQIRSFEKLTTEGMTFANSALLRILEEVLPARYGGASTDYQLVEEARPAGLSQLVLMVSPLVGAVDEAAVRLTFLDELRHDGWSGRLMAGAWDRAGAVTVRRQAPVSTKAGKILPFHLIGSARR
jgi:hypothetical protein